MKSLIWLEKPWEKFDVLKFDFTLWPDKSQPKSIRPCQSKLYIIHGIQKLSEALKMAFSEQWPKNRIWNSKGLFWALFAYLWKSKAQERTSTFFLKPPDSESHLQMNRSSWFSSARATRLISVACHRITCICNELHWHLVHTLAQFSLLKAKFISGHKLLVFRNFGHPVVDLALVTFLTHLPFEDKIGWRAGHFIERFTVQRAHRVDL